MILAVAVLAAVPLYVFARRGELEGNPERFVAVIVAALLVECVLYPAQAETPVGLFRIPFARGNLRTLDYLVAIGVLARLTSRPAPRRIAGTAVIWLVSFLWLATAALRGLMAGHGTNVVLFSAMSLIGLFGALLLVSGCSPLRLVALVRGPFVVPLGALVVVLMFNTAGGEPTTFLGTDLGWISVDTASVFVAIGTFVLLVEWSSRHRRRWATWATLPLFVCPFVLEQRATLVHLGASCLVIGWAMTRPEWRSNVQVTMVQLLWGVLAGVASLMVVVMVQLSSEDSAVPFAGYYEETFASEGQRQSAQARLDSFGVGVDEWASAPVFGHGLGHTYEIVRPGDVGVARPETFDNVPLDLLVRSGVVGLVVFVLAFLATLRDGLTVWRRHPSASVSALALAAVAVMVGLGLKSVFESILEKGKLALVLGLSAGVIAAAVRSMGQTRAGEQLRAPERRGESQWI